MFNDAQRAWITSFTETPGISPAAPPKKEQAVKSQGQGPVLDEDPQALASGEKLGILPVIPAVVIPAVIGAVKDLFGELIARVTIQNETKQPLNLVPASAKLAGGHYLSNQPKGTIAAGQTDKFDAHTEKNLLIASTEDVEGTLQYQVGDSGVIWACHFHNPRIPLVTSNSAQSTLTGKRAGEFDKSDQAGSGNDAPFTFVLRGGGGGGDTPVTPGGVAASCRVTIVNQTQVTLFLRKQDKASGDYVTNPQNSLPPGAQTNFVFAETPNAKDHGCRGLMTWEAGEPAQAKWDLMWDNPKGEKNLTAAFLKPDDGRFHSLDQIDQGDENVPVTFTLSGGGPAKPDPKATSMTLTVENKSDQILTLTSQTAKTGGITTPAPKTIAAGASAVAVAAETELGKGLGGSMVWQAGDPKGPVWTLTWDQPPGQDPAGNSALNPANAGLTTVQHAEKAGGQNSSATYTLAGTLFVDPPDANFDAPPKSKQPTLRKGDKSPDGWVEYAQERLNDNGANLPVDGNFDGKMDAAVHKFQKDHGGQQDGVIGNETWSLLRLENKEPVGTDGRKPHTFEQTDAQARLYHEATENFAYFTSTDTLALVVVSVGEKPVENGGVTVRVTQSSGIKRTIQIKVGPVSRPSPDGQGNLHQPNIPHFLKTFRIADAGQVKDCKLNVYLAGDLGGDSYDGPIKILP